MRRKLWAKLAIALPLLVLLIALDGIAALEGMPLLLMALGVALFVADYLRTWLRGRERPQLAMVPFMAAALLLLLAFCRGRNPSQGVLLLITLAVVFDILLIALAVIAEAGKHGLRGMLEFAGVTALGLALGLAVSIILLLHPMAQLGGISLAGP